MIITIFLFTIGIMIGYYMSYLTKKEYIKQEKYYIDSLVDLQNEIDEIRINASILDCAKGELEMTKEYLSRDINTDE